VPVGGYQKLAYGPLVTVGRGQAEGGDDAFGGYREGHLEAVDPFGLRDAPAEGCLPGEQALAAGPYTNHRRHKGGIEHVVDGRGLEERLGQVLLQRPQLRFEGTDASIELALAQEIREVGA
jgi:hypothetical protein